MKKESQSKEQFNRSMRHSLTIEFKQRSEIFNLIFAQQYFKTAVKNYSIDTAITKRTVNSVTFSTNNIHTFRRNLVLTWILIELIATT